MTAPGAPVPGDTPTELLAIAAELDSIAAFQDRPGAMAEVEALAARLRAAAASEGAEIEELRDEAMRLRSELTEARADRPCADEDCRAFRDGMTVWWERLHDLVADALPPGRPGSPAQIVRAITAALAARTPQPVPRGYHQLTEQEGGPPNERYPDPTAPELAARTPQPTLDGEETP